MHRTKRRRRYALCNTSVRFFNICALLLGVLLLTGLSPVPSPATFKALVFSKTVGFRHASIPNGIAAVRDLATQEGFTVDATEDAAAFTDANLAQYQVVIFLNTTGDVLNTVQQAAFERFIRAGKGYVGVHSAADTEYNWPFYGGLVGAYFQSHPDIRTATVKVADAVHPSTEMLPKRWQRTDEWYNFRHNPRGEVHVLATLDESSYTGGGMGSDHPIMWCHDYEGGRSWYTAGGHTEGSYSEPAYREHLLQGIRYAAGMAPGDCGATVNGYFEKAILDANTDNPMDLAVAPDGRVFFVERAGTLRLYTPGTGLTTTVAALPVVTSNEDGLLGIVLDPDFADNGWIYLFYSPAGDVAKQHVSRFTLVGNRLDLASEQVLLEIPVQREQCCHSAGSMVFDGAGNLFVATGDNTNPFESDGFAPIDERRGRAAWDAQGTSGNMNDLRGKILRIAPQADGSYTIPAGNLFPADGSAGRPEIYVMGVRNPFRIAFDTETDRLYWGDIGPDAGAPLSSRGPEGLDEWNRTRTAGNYGWPYCIGQNRAYVDYNFATGASGAPFNCNAPVNNSPNNTGGVDLPPAKPAWIWYPYAPSSTFPALNDGVGRAAMSGPVYHFDPDLDSKTRLPAYYDDTVFIFEWSRNWIREVKLDDNGDILVINPFAAGIELLRPITMKAGPEGALYLLEWGTGFGGGNDDSKLVRIDYVRGTRAPVAVLGAEPTSGPVPLTVQFSSQDSFDPDPGDRLTFSWDLDGDGTEDAKDPNPTYTYDKAGTFTAQLTVTDATDNKATASVDIIAGNTRPTIALTDPVDGGFFDWGDRVAFAFSVDDAEDGATADGDLGCDETIFQPFIGHNDHSHPLDQFNACEGVMAIIDAHGGPADNLFYIVEASYTDSGVGSAGALTARTQHILHPKRLEAEHFTTNHGVLLERSGDVLGGGQNIGYIEHGDYVSWTPVNLENIGFVTFRVASAGFGGRIEVRIDSPDGPLIGTAHVDRTGEWQRYRDVTAALTDPGGTHELFLVFKNNPGEDGLFNVNWMDFHGPGVALDPGEPEGLLAMYYDAIDFTGEPAERVDPQINFNWAGDAPLANLSSETFSVRWTGSVEAQHNERYTFYAATGNRDGVRLWIDEMLVIDQWRNRAATEASSPPIQLEAHRDYAVRMDYFKDSGLAQAHLLWSSVSTRKAVVPARVLTPAPAITSIRDDELPQQPLLASIHPNPLRQHGTITFTLPASEWVTLEVFDMLGRRVTTLLDEQRGPGIHQTALTTEQWASGAYLCRLTTPSGTATKRFVLLP